MPSEALFSGFRRHFCSFKTSPRADCADRQSHSDGRAGRIKMPSERRLRPDCKIPPAFKTAVETDAIFQYGHCNLLEIMRRPPTPKNQAAASGKVCAASSSRPAGIMICLSVFLPLSKPVSLPFSPIRQRQASPFPLLCRLGLVFSR